MNQKLIEKIQVMVKNNQVREAIVGLSKTNLNEEDRKTIVLIEADYRDFCKNRSILSEDDIRRKKSQIRKNVLEFGEEVATYLDEGDVEKNFTKIVENPPKPVEKIVGSPIETKLENAPKKAEKPIFLKQEINNFHFGDENSPKKEIFDRNFILGLATGISLLALAVFVIILLKK